MLGHNPLVIPPGRTPALGSILAPPPAPIPFGEQNPEPEQHSQEACVRPSGSAWGWGKAVGARKAWGAEGPVSEASDVHRAWALESG